jgi:signal transduction histidine kinase
VNEILDLQKAEKGKIELKAEPIKVASFCVGHIAQFESLAHQNSIDYTYQNNIPEEVYSYIDQEKLRRVIINLLSNAFKFTPKMVKYK